MNIVSPWIPVAAAALDTMVQSVGDVLQSGKSFARLLHDEVTHGEEAGADGPATGLVPEQPALARQLVLRQQFDEQRQLVHQRLLQLCAEREINLSEPAVLTVDSFGRMLETSGHWERAKIEQLLQSDAGMRGELEQLLARGAAVREAGPAAAENGVRGTSRLVVTEKEIFFQVV